MIGFIVKMKNRMNEGNNRGRKSRLMNKVCVRKMIVDNGKELRSDGFCVGFLKKKID